jgi:hypothetical protein
MGLVAGILTYYLHKRVRGMNQAKVHF